MGIYGNYSLVFTAITSNDGGSFNNLVHMVLQSTTCSALFKDVVGGMVTSEGEYGNCHKTFLFGPLNR